MVGVRQTYFLLKEAFDQNRDDIEVGVRVIGFSDFRKDFKEEFFVLMILQVGQDYLAIAQLFIRTQRGNKLNKILEAIYYLTLR